MGLSSRMKGKDIKEWFIKDFDETEYNLIEIESFIKSGKITEETLVYKKLLPISSLVKQEKEWKKASEFHELKPIFNDLPPP